MYSYERIYLLIGCSIYGLDDTFNHHSAVSAWICLTYWTGDNDQRALEMGTSATMTSSSYFGLRNIINVEKRFGFSEHDILK